MLVRLLAVLWVAAVAGCGGTARAAEPVRVPVVMSEFSYGAQVIEVPADRTVELEVRNAGKVDHDLVIDELGVRVLASPGRIEKMAIGPLAPGAYVIHCSIPTHREAGMIATLLVRP